MEENNLFNVLELIIILEELARQVNNFYLNLKAQKH